MKKIYFFLVAALAMFSQSAMAGYRILFSENYESASAVADTKWKSNANPGGLSIASDDFGKFLKVDATNQNQRSYNCHWGQDIFNGVDNTEYDVQFDFCVSNPGNFNQYNSQFALIADPTVKAENGQTSSVNKLFFLEQVKDEDASVLKYTINGDANNTWTPAVGTWYTVYIHVNKADSTVSYYAKDAAGNVALPDGEYSVAGKGFTSMDASTLWYAHARYYNVVYFDNIQVLKDLGEGVDWANEPVIALTGLNKTERTYTISFMEGETLHVMGVDGVENVFEYGDCDPAGQYKYVTSTSGKLQAWTVVNETSSTVASTDVDASVITLPAATVAISSVKAGYAKTWTVNIDKSNVPLQPNIVYDYVFTPEDGGAVLSAQEQSSGSTITVSGKGTLKLTTKAFGYGERDTTIVNNQAFAVKEHIDFQHMTKAELAAKGFVAKEPLKAATGGGESTWTSSSRLHYDWAKGTEVGDTTRVYPFGYPEYGDDGKATGNYIGDGIERMQFLQSGLTKEVADNLFAPFQLWSRANTSICSFDADGNDDVKEGKDGQMHTGGCVNVEIKVGVGLINPGVQGDAQDYDPAKAGYGNIRVANTPLKVAGYDENSFLVVYKVQGYGNNANHGVIMAQTAEEAAAIWNEQGIGTYTEVYKANEEFQLYRIDTAISLVEVLSPLSDTNSISPVVNKADDAEAPFYTISGVKVKKPTAPGIYIQNGKKFIVK